MLLSPRLQQVYGQLGLTRADILDAIQISNPRLALADLAAQGAPGSQFIFGISTSFVDLITLPIKVRLARLDYERTRYEIAAAILGVSLDVETDWYRFVGARQVATMRKSVAEAFSVSAELAQRFYDAGNITDVQLNREKAAASEARLAAARSEVEAHKAKLELNLVMGLSGEAAAWISDESLPLPLAQEDDPARLQQLAQTSNLDLLAAEKGVTVAASAARVARSFRLLGTTSIGFDREREVDRSVIRGPTLDLELPIFNQGGARVARADAQRRIATARLAMARLAATNGIDAAAERVKVMSDIVTVYREALVPQREIIARGSQLEQNYALIGEFEVLQERAQEYDAYQGLLEAIREYWLARVDLSRLVGGRLPSDGQPRKPTPALYELEGRPGGPDADDGHGSHHHHAAPDAPGSSAPDTGHQHHHGEHS